MKNYYLAIDLGATSGRAIVGTLENNQLQTIEINRFQNHFIPQHKHLFWNIYSLFEEILKSIQIAQEKGFHIVSIGIDTWGVDFALLDKDGYLSGLPFTYRDSITNGIVPVFEHDVMSAKSLYNTTGIQIMQLNTVFQLYAQHAAHLAVLNNAQCLLFTPDVLAYLLTDKISVEYTIASTSSLLNANTRQWDFDIVQSMQLPSHLFPEIIMPATVRGTLSPQICQQLNCEAIPIVAVASHDTASAVAAIPAEGNDWAFLSMGTWSLMGIETDTPIINAQSFADGFTNEGGVNHSIRFLKNLTGFWLLEKCMQEWRNAGMNISYAEIDREVESAAPFASFFDTDDANFCADKSVIEQLTDYFTKTQQPIPHTYGAWARCIFESLAMKYRTTMLLLQNHSPRVLNVIHAIGGGTKNTFLCQLTANATQMTVVAGPTEATAAGNILVQALAMRQLKSWENIRAISRNTFETNIYYPENLLEWQWQYQRYLQITKVTLSEVQETLL